MGGATDRSFMWLNTPTAVVFWFFSPTFGRTPSWFCAEMSVSVYGAQPSGAARLCENSILFSEREGLLFALRVRWRKGSVSMRKSKLKDALRRLWKRKDKGVA